jgi:hypothetical protein
MKSKVKINLMEIRDSFECCICEQNVASGYMLTIGIVKDGNTLSLILLNLCEVCYYKYLGIAHSKFKLFPKKITY